MRRTSRVRSSIRLGHLALILLLLPVGCATESVPRPAAPPSITLAQPVHFFAPGGGEAVAPAGSYGLEPGDGPTLRLVPDQGEAAKAPVVAEAVATNLGEPIETQVALHLLWQEDEHHVILLQPSGEGLEAVGTVSGVRSRSIPAPVPRSELKKALGKLKKQ